jgi:hypothetical protein
MMNLVTSATVSLFASCRRFYSGLAPKGITAIRSNVRLSMPAVDSKRRGTNQIEHLHFSHFRDLSTTERTTARQAVLKDLLFLIIFVFWV